MAIDNNISPLSYKSIQQSRQAFRQVSRDGFNAYDEPGTFWFKPIFYFYRSLGASEDNVIGSEGLLHPSWLVDKEVYAKDNSKQEIRKTKHEDLNFTSSAYNYLLRNDDLFRAKLLQRFIELLSNISSQSPWYFKAVGGLDNAVDHSEAFKSGKFANEDRRQITFTMMEDAVDDRIGTLLDLYKTICYSWRSKREIVPSNLRKFDMGLYIFGDMIQNNQSDLIFKYLKGDKYTSNAYEPGEDRYIVNLTEGKKSSMQNNVYLEFTNCEINLSSAKMGDTMDNSEGAQHVYTLVIDYDDCYVDRVNTSIKATIGDSILSDIFSMEGFVKNNGLGDVMSDSKYAIGRSRSDTDYTHALDVDASNINKYKSRLGDQISNTIASAPGKVIGNAIGYGVGAVKQAVTPGLSFLLGNLYHGSLVSGAQLLMSGNVRGVNAFADMGKKQSDNKTPEGRLYEKPEPVEQPTDLSKLSEKPIKKSTPTNLGSLYSKNVMRNL